jgi:hypothetical protein
VRQAEIVLELALDQSVIVKFADTIEVSLDCSHCLRTDRTIDFVVGSAFGQCNPGSAKRLGDVHPPYPGRIVQRVVQRSDSGPVSVIYRLEYEVDHFEDAKYGSALRPWSGYPTWAYISFTLTCPTCGTVNQAETQNNLVRPFSHSCTCGYEFCIERREMPRLRWLDPDSDGWCEVSERRCRGAAR